MLRLIGDEKYFLQFIRLNTMTLSFLNQSLKTIPVLYRNTSSTLMREYLKNEVILK